MRKFLSAKRPTVTVFTDFSRPGGRDLFAGILRQMRTRSDRNVRIVQSLAEMTSDRIRAEESDGVGGFIVSELIDEGFRRAIERSRVPTVVVGNYRNPLPRRTHSISFVHVDDEAIGRFAADYLKRLGKFADYAYLPSAEEFNRHMSDHRRQGFVDALARDGIDVRVFDSAQDDIGQWFDALKKPVALMASHDRRAADLVALRGVFLRRHREMVALLSVDNDDLICNSTDPTLSSISLDTEAEGLAAAGELARLMRAPRATGRHLTVPAKLQVIERSSTLRTVPALHLVRRAQDFISRNAGRRIRVQDVVDDLRVSRRLAETRFRQFCDTSINEAIVEARLAHFAQKLKTHHGAISALARACGFDDPKYLARIFRKRFVKTPREFRDREE